MLYSVTFNLIIIVFKSVSMFVVCLSTYMQMHIQAGRRLQIPGAAVRSCCELFNVGTGKRIAGPSPQPLTLFWGADLPLNLELTNLAVSVPLMGIIVACCHAQLSPWGLGE